jgi:dTDP-4-dehydrorhamnose 3,5-epimerase
MAEHIHQVYIKQLKVIPDERGRLMEILRCDDEMFKKFGQVYMTTVRPGVVKGWHYHTVQTDNMVCVKGMLKLVLYDARPSSPTAFDINEFFIGEVNPLLVQIPPMVFHGFKGISGDDTIVINLPTEPYNYTEPDEHRLPPNDPSVPYEWRVRER